MASSPKRSIFYVDTTDADILEAQVTPTDPIYHVYARRIGKERERNPDWVQHVSELTLSDAASNHRIRIAWSSVADAESHARAALLRAFLDVSSLFYEGEGEGGRRHRSAASHVK